MSIRKGQYSFKDKTWYIIPWPLIDPSLPEVHSLPSYLVHDVDGDNPHRLMLWNYEHLKQDMPLCYNCKCRPSKKIQTLWTLENMDTPEFFENAYV